MRSRTSLFLLVLGALFLALGIFYGSGPREQAPQPVLAFPGLAHALADAAQVEIVHKGATLHLARSDKDGAPVWGVAGRGLYPAQQGKVHELLTGLTELRLDEKRTADAADYARLGVEDPAGKDADSTLLRVLDGKGGVIAALIVGHVPEAPRGNAGTVFVRRPDEAQAWLADGRITASAEPQEWLDRDIISIDAAKIKSVVVTRGDATLTFSRVSDRLTLTDPAEHPKLDEFKVDEVGRALANLSFDTVQPAPAPGTPLGHAVFTTTDGMTVTVEVNKSDAEIWATLAATGSADAAALDTKMKGWAYQLGSAKAAALVPALDDLKAAEPAAK